MVMALTTTEPVKRSDFFFINPFDIEVRNDLRGRKYAPNHEAIIKMAMSLADRGQQQAVQARRLSDNKPLLVMGFTRCAAARLIREGFDGTDNVRRHIPDFKLKVVIVDSNDQEAFERNIVENAVRNETSPIDDAHNHQRLRESYGYSDADIARLYMHSNQNKVSRYRKLLSLSEPVQELIHVGKLGVQAAIDLLALPESEREAALTKAMNDNGVVNGAEIVSQVRDHHLSDDNGTVTPTTGGEVAGSTVVTGGGANVTKPRSVRELRKFFTEMIEGEKTPEAVKEFAKVLLGHVNGKKTDKQAMNAITRLYQAVPEKAEAEAEKAS